MELDIPHVPHFFDILQISVTLRHLLDILHVHENEHDM